MLLRALFILFYNTYIKKYSKFQIRSMPIIENFNNLSLFFGENIVIKENLIIRGGGKLTIADNTHIGSYNIIGCNSSVYIGKNCMIADFVSLRDTDHNYTNIEIPMNEQGITSKEIIIEDDVWIGHGAIILKGVKVGKGAIVGAGSVVTKNIPPNTIVGGIPAKYIGARN